MTTIIIIQEFRKLFGVTETRIRTLLDLTRKAVPLQAWKGP
jgi:hypothetical protein